MWGIYTYLIANEGEINIQLIPQEQAKAEHQGVYEPAETLCCQDFHPGRYCHGDNTPSQRDQKTGDADIEVKIKGEEIPKLFELAQGTAAAMNRLAHFTNVYVSLDMTKPEYQVQVDRQACSRFRRVNCRRSHYPEVTANRRGGYSIQGR